MWSPHNISHTDDQAMMTLERCVYTHQEYISLILRNGHFMTHNYTNASMEEDPKMMAFFDSLVQRELEGSFCYALMMIDDMHRLLFIAHLSYQGIIYGCVCRQNCRFRASFTHMNV